MVPKLLLTLVAGAFILAFAGEMAVGERKRKPTKLQLIAKGIRRGFIQGYSGIGTRAKAR